MARERENNNNTSNADTISIGETVTGNLFNTDDQDFFKFYVDEPSKIKLILTDNQVSTPADFTKSEGSWDISIISADSAETINGYNNIDKDNPDGTIIDNYIIKPGWYYVLITQDYVYEHTDTDYEFKLIQEKGFYKFGYEGNDVSGQATELKFKDGEINKIISNNYEITSDGWVYSNLYHVTRDEHVNDGFYDKDYFKFNLSGNTDEIVITFDTLGGDDFYLDSWEFSLYDSDRYLIQSKIFLDSGSFTIGTKSSGDFYLKITQENWDRVDPSLFKFKITTEGNSNNTNSNTTVNTNTSADITSTTNESSTTKISSKYFQETLNTNKGVAAENVSVAGSTINYSSGNDIIILQSVAIYRGLRGDDTYVITNLTPSKPSNGIGEDVQIVDTSGNNTIQIVDNTFIKSILFAKNALQINLSDTKQVTVPSADKYNFNIGANITSGDVNDNLSYSQFAEVFGIENVLNLSSSQNVIVDMYVI